MVKCRSLRTSTLVNTTKKNTLTHKKSTEPSKAFLVNSFGKKNKKSSKMYCFFIHKKIGPRDVNKYCLEI